MFKVSLPPSAVATLTYVYADSTAVLGPLATYAEPHCYDLCEQHAGSLTVPRGWEVLRLAMPTTPQQPGPDDLLALANAVREAACGPPPQTLLGPARRAFGAGGAGPRRKAPAAGTCASCANLPDASVPNAAPLWTLVGWNLLISQPPARCAPLREHQPCQRSVLNCCPSCAAP